MLQQCIIGVQQRMVQHVRMKGFMMFCELLLAFKQAYNRVNRVK